MRQNGRGTVPARKRAKDPTLSESKPPRRPGGRRPVPPLIFLLVLAILALAVWWKVIRSDEDQQVAANAPCTLTATPEQIATLQNMANIRVYVLNGSDQTGLAASIGNELTARGFTVLDIGNAPSDAGVGGAGKIQYGPGAKFAADVLNAQFNGFEVERITSITDGTITLTAGQSFQGLIDPNVAQPVVNDLITAEASVLAGCPSQPANP